MMRFVADENFNNDILRGLTRRNPRIDTVRIQDVGLSGASDPLILEWAAQEGRIFLTHDVATMTYYAYERVRAGKKMPGVIEASRDTPIGAVIEDILLIYEVSLPGEWEGRVLFLPLG